MPESAIIALRHPFVKAVQHALRHRCGVTEGSRVVAAVSGGSDSVAMLLALASIAPRRGWRLAITVAHVQHHLRDDAEADARFVAELAAKLGLPFARRDLDLSKSKANLESAARAGRYAALLDIAREAGASLVATAHHGDDQLETLLMRLMRGSSVKGLAGMAWRRRIQPGSDVHLIRPMLAADHAAAVSLLEHLNQPWRTDHTNADIRRDRARLREQVLPVLRQMKPDVARRTVMLCDHVRDVAKVVDASVRSLATDMLRHEEDGSISFDRRRAREQSSTTLTGMVRAALLMLDVAGDKLTTRTIGPAIAAIRDGRGNVRHFTFAGGVRMTVRRDRVVMSV